MGLFSLFRKKSLKEKASNKIYDSIFTKEYMFYELELNNKLIDSLLICSYGIFIFKIIATNSYVNINGNTIKIESSKNEYDINDILNELDKDSVEIFKIIDNKINIEKRIIITSKNDYELKDFNIESFIDSIDKREKIITNEEIETIYSLLLPFKKHEF